MKREKKRVVGYVRVSTAGQVEGTSLDDQRQKIESYCKSQGYKFLQHYCDEGASGSAEERPQFQKMIGDAKKDVFDLLAVSTIDRLSRNLKNFINTREMLKDIGVGLISVQEQIDTESDTGDFTINLLSLIAEFERKQISRRTKSGKRAAALNGSYLPGRAPFGYNFNKETKTIEINEEQEKVYLEIVDLYTIDHLSTPKIADVMTERRYKTPGSSIDGKRPISTVWNSDMILRILKNTAYYGESTYFTRQYETAVCKETGMPYHKRTLKKSDEESIVIKFPPMITKVKWDEIQSQIIYNKKKPRTNRRKHATETFLVSDTLGRQFRCGLCGSKIAAKVRKRYRSGRVFYQYMCAKHYQSNKQLKAKGYNKCPLPSVDSRDADFEVWKEICFLIANPVKFLRTWLPKENFDSKADKIAALHEKLKRKKTGLDRMTNLIATIEDETMVNSYIKKQYGLSKDISRIEASIKTLKLEQHSSAEAIKYLRKVVNETEKVITRVEEEAKIGGDVDRFVIPSVYDKLEAITDFDIRRRILSSVVAPENGGYVELTYNFEKNEGPIEHAVKVNAMLNVRRVANIIRRIRSESGSKMGFKLSNGCDGSGRAHHVRTKLAGCNTGFSDHMLQQRRDVSNVRPGPQAHLDRLAIHRYGIHMKLREKD